MANLMWTRWMSGGTVLAVSVALVTGCGGSSWSLHRYRYSAQAAQHIEIQAPSTWTEPHLTSPPGVLLGLVRAHDPTKYVGVQIVKLPSSTYRTLDATTRLAVSSIRSRSIQGGIGQQAIHLPSGQAEELQYIQAEPVKLFIEQYFVINHGTWALGFTVAPAAQGSHYGATFERVARSFRVLP